MGVVVGLIRWGSRLGAGLTLAVVGPLTGYLVVLIAGALRETWRRTEAPQRAQTPRFAVLVPAHNEAGTIERGLQSLQRQQYPADAYRVFVVADNCTDATASVARSHGATVYERQDLDRRGKGHALAWLIDVVRGAGPVPDIWLVLDADTVAAPDLLDRLAARVERGAAVVQARYDVRNIGGGWSSDLRSAALGLVHHVRPLGKRWYGGSAGLKGNGMALTDAALRAVPWQASSLAEDVEQHLRLLEQGYRVEYEPTARVWADMPATLSTSQSQNERWEAGRLAMVRQRIPEVLGAGLRRGDPALVDAAVEQIVPPLAALIALTGAGLAAAVLGGSGRQIRGLMLCGLGQALYTIVGLKLAGASSTVWLALLRAPVYIVWKAWLYLRMLIGGGPDRWVRTERAEEKG